MISKYHFYVWNTNNNPVAGGGSFIRVLVPSTNLTPINFNAPLQQRHIFEDGPGKPAIRDEITYIIGNPVNDDDKIGLRIPDSPENLTREDVIVPLDDFLDPGDEPGTEPGTEPPDAESITGFLGAILFYLNSIIEWLIRIWEAVLSVPGLIVQWLMRIWEMLNNIWLYLVNNLTEPTVNVYVDVAVETPPAPDVNVTVSPPDPEEHIGKGSLNLDNLRTNSNELAMVFPFCIPFDFIRAVSSLTAPPKAPVYEIDFSGIPHFYDYKWTLDMSEFEILAATLGCLDKCIYRTYDLNRPFYKVVVMLLELFQSIIDGFADILALIVGLLPPSPFLAVESVMIDSELLSFIAWLVPFPQIIALLTAWGAAIMVYYVYMVIARWIKLIG